jgi:hypothetical protein
MSNKKAQMIQIRTFKEKKKEGSEGRPQFGGQWKVLMLSGPWKVPSLVAFGTRKRNIHFTYFHFPPNKFYLNLFKKN